MANRTEVIQILVEPTLRAKLENMALRLDLSLSSAGELILGAYFAQKENKTLHNHMEV